MCTVFPEIIESSSFSPTAWRASITSTLFARALVLFNITDTVPCVCRLIKVALLQSCSLFLFILLIVAYFTLMERHFIASIQRRQGPNVVGFFGLLQPIADGIKLLTKELIIPSQANAFFFFISPILVFIYAFIQWAQIYIGVNGAGHVLSAVNLSMLYMGAFGSVGSVGIFLSGWASNSKYALLGALRSIAQIISYELALSTVFLCMGAFAETINLYELIILQTKTISFVFPLLPIWIIFFIITLAETNRSPFDLPEGESEIVAGFNVEYSGILFALFFLGEYAKILAVSALHILFFFSGSVMLYYSFFSNILFFGIKTLLMSYVFILIRAVLPRYRVDQLMSLGWKTLLPTLFIGFILIITYKYIILVIWEYIGPYINYMLDSILGPEPKPIKRRWFRR
jgi:NADH:ubiquinone oxidoreductase subunit H